MHWNDRIFSGTHEKWHWIVSCSSNRIARLVDIVISEHIGCRLCITAFDSGPIFPSDEETAGGWGLVGDAMVSPPISARLEIPHDGYDEWYIFKDQALLDNSFERFVNYGGFNLADPRELANSFDPTWDRSGLDWLYPIQERFWKQMDSISPVSYVASGDNDVIVTQRQSFFDAIRRSVE